MPDSRHNAPVDPSAPAGHPQASTGRTAAHDAKAYAAPALVVYGTLPELTETVGPRGMNDKSGKRKTGF